MDFAPTRTRFTWIRVVVAWGCLLTVVLITVTAVPVGINVFNPPAHACKGYNCVPQCPAAQWVWCSIFLIPLSGPIRIILNIGMCSQLSACNLLLDCYRIVAWHICIVKHYYRKKRHVCPAESHAPIRGSDNPNPEFWGSIFRNFRLSVTAEKSMFVSPNSGLYDGSKVLLQKQKEDDRRARNHRLCKRGGYLKKSFPIPFRSRMNSFINSLIKRCWPITPRKSLLKSRSRDDAR